VTIRPIVPLKGRAPAASPPSAVPVSVIIEAAQRLTIGVAPILPFPYREFYRSARGPAPSDYDAWRLVCDPSAARLVVRHEWQTTGHSGVDEFALALGPQPLADGGGAQFAILTVLWPSGLPFTYGFGVTISESWICTGVPAPLSPNFGLDRPSRPFSLCFGRQAIASGFVAFFPKPPPSRASPLARPGS
jgi:hypothetical protein